MPVVSQDALPFSVIAREFMGHEHGNVGVSLLFVDAPPGKGPLLHRHPYEELILVLDGEATFVLGDEELEARTGDIVIVPANEPHSFVNTGEGSLRQIDIHVSPKMITEWLVN